MHTCCHMAFKMLCELFYLKCNTLHTIPKYIIIQRGAAYPTLPQCKENAWCRYFGQQRAVQLWHLYTQERNRCVCKLKYLVHLNGWTEHMRRKDKMKTARGFWMHTRLSSSGSSLKKGLWSCSCWWTKFSMSTSKLAEVMHSDPCVACSHFSKRRARRGKRGCLQDTRS